jgi:tetratricopeptide (TPR) repeat protein
MSAAAVPATPNPLEAALALRAAGRLQDALNALSTISEDTSEIYTLRAEIQFALGRFHEAAGSYFTAVASEPENVLAQFNLGVCMQQLNRWDDAALAFERVLEIDPDRDDARVGLGACLLRLKRPEEALAVFDACWSEAVRTRSDFGKAVALQFLRRFDESEAAYQGLLQSGQQVEEVLTNLVALSAEIPDWEAVQHYASRLIELSPQCVPALQGLAAVALERSDFGAAVQYCGRIVELAPDCMEALHNLRFATGQVMADLQKRAATQPPPGKIRHSRTLPKSRQQADRADSTHGSGASNSPEAQNLS